jgi:TonB-linked SusC/RagA family outer membrane protein
MPRIDMTRAGHARSLIAALFAILVAGDAWAQAAIIRGRVTNAQGAPVPGAIVQITAMNLRTTATMSGAYSLAVPEGRATGQQVVVLARFIGYRPQNQTVTLTAGTHELDFRLEVDPFRLEEVVVTGVAEATSARKLTFSVAKVSEEQIREVPASSPITALAGKVAGVRIASGLGTPGAAPTIRLRGSTSLGVGQSAPLIIVDGVITRNAISDLDANDIESVEVLKGAAASAFYGSDAANGVVNVTTKRGRNLPENRVSFNLRSEYGQTGVVRFPPLNTSHYWELNPDGSIRLNAQGAPIPKADRIADNPYPSTGPERWRNQLKEWLTNGEFHNVNLQMGLRRGNTNFNSSFTSDHNQGILPMTTGALRRNVRLNVDQGIGTQADFSASLTYGLTTNDFNPSGEATGTFFNLLQAPPDVDLENPNPTVSDVPFYPGLPTAKNPSARSNPLYALANQDFFQRRERIIGSFSARYRPWEWLRLDASYGTDRLNRLDRTYQFRGYLGEAGQPTPGFLERETRNNVADNAQVSGTATRLWFGNLLSTTRAAYLLETARGSFVGAAGSRLNVTAVPDLSAVDPDQITINSADSLARTINYMVSQGLDFRDRYLFDVLYRRDGSSLFGPNERWKDFYRVSGAYRISEDFTIPGVQELKIRAARGTAGLRPSFLAQYETYTVSAGQITKAQLGNLNLKPAIQTETEYGVNSTFLDRFDLEVVYADRKTRDAFLNVPLSLAQSGGFSTQVQNAATIGANTVELSLQTRVIDRPNFSYSFSLTGDRTRQKILEMNRAPFRPTFGGQGQGQAVFYYKEGEPLGIIYGARWVRSFEELRQNPAFASANPADYVVNPLGFLVLASTRGQPTEMPIRYVATEVDPVTGQTVTVNQFKIGDVNPDFAFGWANNIRVKGFGIYVLFDGQKGGDVYNFSKQWMFQDWRHGDIDQRGKAPEQKIALPFFASGLYNGLDASDYFVEDASYVKLRELSVSYTLSRPLLGRLGVNRFANGVKVALIGRNLYTWTDYTGFDPEVTSGGDFNYRIEGFRYPNFRTITGQVEIQF